MASNLVVSTVESLDGTTETIFGGTRGSCPRFFSAPMYVGFEDEEEILNVEIDRCYFRVELCGTRIQGHIIPCLHDSRFEYGVDKNPAKSAAEIKFISHNQRIIWNYPVRITSLHGRWIPRRLLHRGISPAVTTIGALRR